jgi:hypothetical protein
MALQAGLLGTIVQNVLPEWGEVRRALLEWQDGTPGRVACAQHQRANPASFVSQQAAGSRRLSLQMIRFLAGARQAAPSNTVVFSITQRLRDEVFISAMAAPCFIDAAAKPLRLNLGALMNVFTTQTLRGQKQALLPVCGPHFSLWCR